jgi:hypothetical protein
VQLNPKPQKYQNHPVDRNHQLPNFTYQVLDLLFFFALAEINTLATQLSRRHSSVRAPREELCIFNFHLAREN